MSRKVLPRNPKGELFQVEYNKFKDENEYFGKNTQNISHKIKKITYLVMTSQKYKDRQNNVLKTWGSNVDLHFYSDGEADKTIKVTDKDDYWSLEEKHVNIFKRLKYDFLDREWFFFCDDDTFVNIKNLSKFVDYCDKDSAYGSLINCWDQRPHFYYHSGGAGVLIHRNSLDKLSFDIEHLNTLFADVTLGLNLQESGIKMLSDKRFHAYTPEVHHANINEIKNCFTFHHIKNFEQMQHLHQICTN
jgi:hypothetical protein